MSQTAPGGCPAFVVAAEGYDRLMGRYLPSLGPAFADAAGITGGLRVLDVGCGPGGLTGELARRTGAAAVAALDPSPPFVQACRERHPGVDVRIGVAEQLPFDDGEFDAALACLVVGFLSDAHAGIVEMSRVTRPGGTVAACFWDVANMPAIQTVLARGRAGRCQTAAARSLASAAGRAISPRCSRTPVCVRSRRRPGGSRALPRLRRLVDTDSSRHRTRRRLLPLPRRRAPRRRPRGLRAAGRAPRQPLRARSQRVVRARHHVSARPRSDRPPDRNIGGERRNAGSRLRRLYD